MTNKYLILFLTYILKVFLGKCYTKNTNGNCTGLWDAFDTVASMDNSKITDADYDPLFQVANFSTPANSILFWSGTKVYYFYYPF